MTDFDRGSLRRVITGVAHNAARQAGTEITKRAVDWIVSPDTQNYARFSKLKTIPDVDLQKLQEAIEALVKQAIVEKNRRLATSKGRKAIRLSDAQAAMSKVTCHYLWFC